MAEVCRKMDISEATFYNCKRKYGGLGTSELRRLKQLKKIVADLTLDKQMLQDVLKKTLRARQRRQLAAGFVEEYRVSKR